MATPCTPPLFFNAIKKSWAVVFCGLLITTSSCQKEQDVAPTASAITTADIKVKKEPKAVRQGRHLKFDSRQDFARVIKDLAGASTSESADEQLAKWEQRHNFTSLRAHRQNKRQAQKAAVEAAANRSTLNNFTATDDGTFVPVLYETPATEQDFIEDDLLATLVSPDQTIQIGDATYRLDGETNRVYYTVSENADVYAELISDTPSSPDIYWYPMEENVLDLRDAGVEGESSRFPGSIGGGSGVGCGSGAGGKKSDGGVQYSKNQRLDCKLVYQSVGIYFSIIAKGESQVRSFGVWWAQTSSVTLEPQAPNYVKWLPKCETTWNTDATTYYNFKQPLPNESIRSKVTKRYYEDTKGLKQFNCTVRMYDLNGRVPGPVLHIEA